MSYKLIYLARRNPSVSREDWPRTWRSHAIFASQFPVLEAKIDYMRYCNRIDAPMLNGKPCELRDVSTSHDGVAIAGGQTLEGLTGAGFSDEDRARIDADELRVFDMLTPNFTYYCTETLLRDGRPGEAAVFRFLARKADLSREEFTARLDGDHTALVRATIEGLSEITRYAHDHPVHEPRPRFPFDGISECWFATAEDAIRALSGGALEAVERGLDGFCDTDGCVTMLTSVCHRWPRA